MSQIVLSPVMPASRTHRARRFSPTAMTIFAELRRGRASTDLLSHLTGLAVDDLTPTLEMLATEGIIVEASWGWRLDADPEGLNVKSATGSGQTWD